MNNNTTDSILELYVKKKISILTVDHILSYIPKISNIDITKNDLEISINRSLEKGNWMFTSINKYPSLLCSDITVWR